MDKIKHDLAGLVEEAAANMRQLMTAAPSSGTVGAQVQEAQRAASRLFSGVMATNKLFAEALLDRAEPGPAVELQRRFVGEYFDALAQGGTLVLRAAGEAAQQSSDQAAPERGHRENGAGAALAGGAAPAPTKRARRPRSQVPHKSGALVRGKAAK
ncbi:hypothetical protein [Belnapia rosea]|jgi:hypothetical protein|uniref:hypothetical protein n=1 Tax=Belnapia rosea TaxID=938405 RepID=UPI00115F811E|nr:hypothetical protein [Belnapia rosea]